MSLDYLCAHQLLTLGYFQWPIQQVSLHLLAADILQKFKLILFFDTLGDDLEAKTLGQRDSGADNRFIILVTPDVPDKFTIDLQAVQWKALEVNQRRMTGAKVIDGKQDAGLFQLLAESCAGSSSCCHPS